MGITMAWLREASGSVWPCVVLHASHNIIVQGVLDAMTARDGHAVFVTTEFGWGMALTQALMAVYIAVQGGRKRGLMWRGTIGVGA
ncbi:CPBP family intramembrane glutamic endopeptidase [Luteibacter aegosomatissinici]|uniref:CPBP family intramembrane glutamic endopeptidase n=1 Tax=Luteibacter aegosomatissinici TaxID=2911539 RepID=UPI0021116944|nr:CPBP family intramembrane glutamic endopeptidase [Luteibacter aegosomatissinici]